MSNLTRFHLAIGILVGFLAEAVIKGFLPGFPFIELVTAQGTIVTFYFTAKTVGDIKTVKYTQAALPWQSTKPPCPEGEPKP